MKVYDTSALLNLKDELVLDEESYIPLLVLKELENIKSSVHKDDEIKFVLTGTTQNQVTYTYNLPVPVVDKKHPYKARATLVYFTQCDRAQGVDYPCCEIEFKFGRFNPKNSENM